MSDFRIKLVVLTVAVFVLLFNAGCWYINLDAENITNIEKKEFLSHKEAKAAAKYYDPEQEYFYESKYVELRQKTLIPFIYKYDTISRVNRKLMGRYR